MAMEVTFSPSCLLLCNGLANIQGEVRKPWSSFCLICQIIPPLHCTDPQIQAFSDAKPSLLKAVTFKPTAVFSSPARDCWCH